MKKFVSLCAVFLLCSGCAVVTTQALTGFVFSEMTSPGSISSANLGTKSGTSSAESFLGAIARGDAGINTAATGAGLSSVSHVDYKSYSIFGLYAKIETYAYGN